MIFFRQRGDFKKTEKFLKKSFRNDCLPILEKFGRIGVQKLEASTPRDTGLTASSWSYEIIQNDGKYSIVWKNSNINHGVNIAVILQYGHATKNGGYVQGVDYINPALRRVFDQIAEEAWREVAST